MSEASGVLGDGDLEQAVVEEDDMKMVGRGEKEGRMRRDDKK